jgi:hypothetical protein
MAGSVPAIFLSGTLACSFPGRNLETQTDAALAHVFDWHRAGCLVAVRTVSFMHHRLTGIIASPSSRRTIFNIR